MNYFCNNSINIAVHNRRDFRTFSKQIRVLGYRPSRTHRAISVLSTHLSERRNIFREKRAECNPRPCRRYPLSALNIFCILIGHTFNGTQINCIIRNFLSRIENIHISVTCPERCQVLWFKLRQTLCGRKRIVSLL